VEKKFTFQVDSLALLYLTNKQEFKGELARWMLLQQEVEYVATSRVQQFSIPLESIQQPTIFLDSSQDIN
jgi:hypothetical protein